MTLPRLWLRTRDAFFQWFDDTPFQMSAALAYYTFFSIAPLLLIAIAVAGSVIGREASQVQLIDAIEDLVGFHSARAIIIVMAIPLDTGGSGKKSCVRSLSSAFDHRQVTGTTGAIVATTDTIGVGIEEPIGTGVTHERTGGTLENKDPKNALAALADAFGPGRSGLTRALTLLGAGLGQILLISA